MTQADAPTPDKPRKSKRRWFQFRLRTLLILTTIVAVWLGWWSHKARQQREAVEALREMWSSVDYDSRLPMTRWMEDPPKWPQWFLDPVRVDYFANVGRVQAGERTTDLKYVKVLTNLQYLDLHSVNITDTEIEHLQGLTSLQYISLSGTQVTDAGLEHIKGLSALEYLYLQDTQITDAGLQHLKGLTALQALLLSGTKITDAGLENLKGMSDLRDIDLRDTQVTDAGIARLRELCPKCGYSR